MTRRTRFGMAGAIILLLVVIASVVWLWQGKQESAGHNAAVPSEQVQSTSPAVAETTDGSAELRHIEDALNTGDKAAQLVVAAPTIREQLRHREGSLFPAGTKVAIDYSTLQQSGTYAEVDAKAGPDVYHLQLAQIEGTWYILNTTKR